MILRRIASVAILSAVAAAALAAPGGENKAPRDLWSQAANAAMNGSINDAFDKTNELITTGKSYGLLTFPAYASSAAALARESDKAGKKDLGLWATKAADQLDPHSPAVAFSSAERAREQKAWPRALQSVVTGLTRVWSNYRTSLLGRCDLVFALALALTLAAVVFGVALFIRYGRSMSHDFREILSTRFHGGSVSVLAFALLFLPLFLWLGPAWLLLYWFAIFFGYANKVERVLIVVFALAIGAMPIVVDRTATWAAGVDNPIVAGDLASATGSYYPEALRRMEEVSALAPDNDVVQLLLGNLELQEGNEQQAEVHYRHAQRVKDSAGAHVNIGNLHFLNGDFAAANTEYEKAQELDSKLAIAFFNESVASGEMYKFDVQGQKLEQAKKIDRNVVEKLTQTPPPQKIVMYTPPLRQAWETATALAKKGTVRTLFGTYAWFDPAQSATNPITIGSLAAILLAIALWLKRRRAGFANACIKCGRTFCHRCKSARESATYCTQCIHIYLKRDGVSLDTKRRKLEEVSDHYSGVGTRNKYFATFLPGSAQVLEGRTVAGAIGSFVFILFVVTAVLTGRLAPALGPVADTAQLLVRIVMGVLAVITWFVLTMPVYRRKVAVG
jgi:tetratricopeptide (TPR) repeat protein